MTAPVAVTVRTGTRQVIDRHVEKVLRGLGNPEPPLDLAVVRDLLTLDRAFYSSTDDSAIQETIHRVRVAGKQVLRRPALLLDVIRKLDLRGLYLPDRKRILLDQDIPLLKQRWTEAHEIGHSILDWHDEALLGDNDISLTASCRVKVEAEANFAAGRLLFLGSVFDQEIRDCAPSMAAVRSLATRYGNTITSTLWRFVEHSPPNARLVGLVSRLPRDGRAPGSVNPAEAVRHVIHSTGFVTQFGLLDGAVFWPILQGYCADRRGGHLGVGSATLIDLAGRSQTVVFETFSNNYDALTIGVCSGPAPIVIPIGSRSARGR